MSFVNPILDTELDADRHARRNRRIPVKFRKKPVVIEAWQIPPVHDAATREGPPDWLIQALVNGQVVAIVMPMRPST